MITWKPAALLFWVALAYTITIFLTLIATVDGSIFDAFMVLNVEKTEIKFIVTNCVHGVTYMR